MMQKKIYIIIFVSVLIFIRCSSDVTKSEKPTEIKPNEPIKTEIPTNDLSIDVNGIVCWINSMPGTEKPKFQVSGDVILPESKKYTLEDIKIKSLVISQDKAGIYYIRPTQVFDILEKTKNKRIRFSTLKGLNLIPELNKNKSVNIEIIFTDSKNNFSYYLNNIKIEEAY